MCRNIKSLYNYDPPATDDEVQAAALQFVRKISGFNSPSQVNEKVFNVSVNDIAKATKILLYSLSTQAHPHNRELEIAKARERTAQQFSSKTH